MPSNPTPDDELSPVDAPLTDPVDPGVPADVPADVPVQNPDEIAALRAELAELRREQQARARADAVTRGQPIEHPNTHVLVLANGKTVETLHPSTTHVSFADDDGNETIVPVTGRYEIHPS